MGKRRRRRWLFIHLIDTRNFVLRLPVTHHHRVVFPSNQPPLLPLFACLFFFLPDFYSFSHFSEVGVIFYPFNQLSHQCDTLAMVVVMMVLDFSPDIYWLFFSVFYFVNMESGFNTWLCIHFPLFLLNVFKKLCS